MDGAKVVLSGRALPAALETVLWTVGGAAFAAATLLLPDLADDLPAGWVRVLVGSLLGLTRAPVVQLAMGGGRVDNRPALRMTIGGMCFTLLLCTFGLPSLACAALGITTVVHLGWSGHRTMYFALGQGVVTSLLTVVAVHHGVVPSLLEPEVADAVTAVLLLFFLALVMNIGLITRDRELAQRALEHERERHTEELRHIATHDQLTGLLDRGEVFHRLESVLLAASPTAQVAVLFADLDGFKAVNDTYGHGAGDSVLLAVSGRLRAGIRDDELVARLGGDEFLLVLSGLPDAAAAHAAGRRIEAAVTGSYVVGPAQARIGMSIGVAVTAEPAPASTMVEAADLAMYAVKAERRHVAVRRPQEA